jgi:AcrR family transcriptional regulator
MPKAFSEPEKEYIRQQLIVQGQKQFSAFGLKKTNVEELAAAAGISKGAFYIFYESKEALFMEVAEQTEIRFRREVLAMLNQSDGSPHQRLFSVLKKAFTLWKTMPILQLFTRSDYELIFHRIGAEKLRAHLNSDYDFLETLRMQCCQAGIPIRVNTAEISNLMYVLFLFTLHEDNFPAGNFIATLDVLIDLVTAFCLGEVAIQPEILLRFTVKQEEPHESGH